MITISMDMEQYDCPFIATSDDHDVTFTTLHWDFNPSVDQLETRIVVDGEDRGALSNGLSALRDHDNMRDYELLSKRGGAAHVRTVIGETDAMATIRDHDGYITGPFHIEDGSETWNVGFDSPEVTDRALGGLEVNNEFDILSRERLRLDTLQRFARNADAAATLVEGCSDLSEVERETLTAAVEHGYFDTPRNGTLETIADEFGVSAPAVSKNLRRAQRKVNQRVVDALDSLR
ncbi:helix-turn-helix domain-containing protein [Halorussus caseinilyticus]|uniref:Helix-turn-helix domain-containing protein n=1 Tax=Halorussus caseinilyticus TaxID=3034025 RepID=A0ABD5WMZ9_9EURY|nr:helix-turn-helix domain-containing protein [Halorussus sp. DT72]